MKLKTYTLIGRNKKTKNITHIKSEYANKDNFRFDAKGNGIVPYLVLTEEELEAHIDILSNKHDKSYDELWNKLYKINQDIADYIVEVVSNYYI